MLTTLELASRQATVGDMSVANNILNSSPQTSQEKSDCSKRLTPQQMHQVTQQMHQVRSRCTRYAVRLRVINQYLIISADFQTLK